MTFCTIEMINLLKPCPPVAAVAHTLQGYTAYGHKGLWLLLVDIDVQVLE